MNPTRHAFLTKCLSQSHGPVLAPNSLRLLDVGCGGGIFAESAARLPSVKSVLGIDASSEVLKVAETHRRKDPALVGGGKRLTYLETPIESLAAKLSQEGESQQFDVVSVFEVVEHVTNPPAFLRSCASHLAPGGWLVLSTIARSWTSWVVTKLVAEDLLGIVPRGTHDWGRYINEDELRGFFAKESAKGKGNGWEMPMVMGVMYVPGIGWREVTGGEHLGNYFFAIRKSVEGEKL